jgi:formamidopyrimidine-DNA glycosylase
VGARVESVLTPGMVAVKSVTPPMSALVGRRATGVGRVGKMLVIKFSPDAPLRVGSGEAAEGPAKAPARADDPAQDLALLVHLMSAGRVQVFDKRASLRDRASRVLIRLDDGRELRLREFGTKQRAWAKLMPADAVAADDMVATLGPEAWPAPSAEVLAERLDEPRHLHPLLRDQRVIAGIGRSWVDEVLWEGMLSPFRKGSELGEDEIDRLREAFGVLGAAIEHYEGVVGDEVPDKMPMPLRVHRRQGEPCPRCGTTLEAVHFAEHVMTYCPAEQTGGRVLKDRRLSRLLK